MRTIRSVVALTGAFLTTYTCTSATEPQVDIPWVDEMPKVPSPLHIINWKQQATSYYQQLFNPNLTGANLPAVEFTGGSAYSGGFSFPPYLDGSTDVNGEAMTCLSPVIGAQLVGMTMTGSNSYEGYDWVQNSHRWFNSTYGFYMNRPAQQQGSNPLGWGIRGTFPMALGVMMTASDPTDPTYSANMSTQCASLLTMAQALGCPNNTNLYQKYYPTTQTAVPQSISSMGIWQSGEGSAMGWLLYMGYLWTGNSQYLTDAESCLQWHLNNPARGENSQQYGPLAVARIDAEQGGNIDLRAMLNIWFGDKASMAPASSFGPQVASDWSVTSGTNFSGLNCDGLDGAGTDPSDFFYAFSMDAYQDPAWLAPVARYDQRYASVIGRSLLNTANSCRFFLGIDQDWNHQDHKDWRDTLSTNNGTNITTNPWTGLGYLFSYEAFRSTANQAFGSNNPMPYATGDCVKGQYGINYYAVPWQYWTDKAGTTVPADGIHFSQASGNIALYMGNHIGFLGAIFNQTNVNGIIAWDLLKTDYFHAPAYPTYLISNPYNSAAAVVLKTGTSAVDIYDTVSGVFVARNVTGNQTINIGPLQTMVLVYPPTGGTVTYQGTQMLINGVIVDYRSAGNGLRGEYCNNKNGANPSVIQVDPQVNFNWGEASPVPGIGATGYSARWSGCIVPQTTEIYTISTFSDDGVRVWVNGNLLINNWTDHAATTNSGTVALTANQPAQIQVEYYHDTGHSTMQLLWSSPSISQEVIPQSRMSPATGNGLQAQYYSDQNLSVPAMTRTDSTISFNWGAAAPDPTVSSTAYSVRWTGYVVPSDSATYTFTTYTTGGVRLLLNGAPVIADWNATAPLEHTFQVDLPAHQPVSIEMDYFNAPGTGTAQLTWNSTTDPKAEVIPANYLSTAGVQWSTWTDADIGSPGVAGSAVINSYAGGSATVAGGGAQIGNTSDQFNFFSAPVNGDQTLMTEVTGISNTDPGAKAGVMFRDSSASGSIDVGLFATEANGVNLQWRSATGGACIADQVSGVPAPTTAQPVWLMLIKSGTTYTGYYSLDSIDWNLVGSTSVTLTNSQYLAGLAVTANNNSLLNTASFSSTSLSANLEGAGSGEQSESYTWSGGTSGTWSATDTNWGGTGQTNLWATNTSPGNIATFGTPSLTGAVSGTVYSDGLTFDSSTTLSSGTIELGDEEVYATANATLNSAVNFTQDLSIDIESGADLTLAGSISSGSSAFDLVKLGVGTLTLTGNASALDMYLHVNNGIVLSHSLPYDVNLGDLPEDGATLAEFFLTSPGDVESGRVFVYGQPGLTLTFGGMNTSGVVYINNWMNSSGDISVNLMAATGGEVSATNFEDNSLVSVVKVGGGKWLMGSGGASTVRVAFSGTVTIDNGAYLVGADDSGNLVQGTMMANGNSSTGCGGSLGFSPYSQTVELGDANTQAAYNLELLTEGGTATNPTLIGHNLSINGQNTSGTTTLGGDTGSNALFAGNISLSGPVALTAAAGCSTTFSGTWSTPGGGAGSVAITGSGSVTLGSGLTFASPITVSGAALQIGSNVTLNATTATTTINSAVAFTGSTTMNIGSGAGLILAGAVSFTGSNPSQYTLTNVGPGALTISGSALPMSVTVNNGTVSCTSPSANVGTVNLSSAAVPGATQATFLFMNPGDSTNYRVVVSPQTGLTDTFGGSNTSGIVYYNNNMDCSGTISVNLMAATGGEVSATNFVDNSHASVVKVGGGKWLMRNGGANLNSLAFSGTVTIDNGAYLVGADDSGTLAQGTVMANGNSSNGIGGSLGYSPYSQTVELGDANTQAAYNLELLTEGGTASHPTLVGHNLSINGQNTSGTTTLGGDTGSNALFSGNISLNGPVALTAAAGCSTTFSGTLSNPGGTGSVSITGSGSVTLTGSASVASVTVAAGSQLTVNGGSLIVTGNIVNSGTLVLSGNCNLSAGGTIINYGVINNTSNSYVLPGNVVNHGTINN